MILKHRDRELQRFEWLEPQGVRVLSVNEAEKRFLPLEMRGEATDKTLWEWLVRRTVPKHRKNIEMLLAALGLSSDNIQGIIGLCHGLSLNDVYWVVPDAYCGLWKDNNLYTNKFSDAIAKIAFSGELPRGREEWTSSPELTTNGMLAKCWRRLADGIYLYKAGTEGAGNTGFEPYSEFYAAQIAKTMGIGHVDYGLSMMKGKICSTCPLFTSDRYGYLPAGRLISKDEALGDECFADIFLFDAIIYNTDRHMGNFGYLIDNDTNEIVGVAPIFDNGYGLYSLAVDREGSKFDEFDDLSKFVSRIQPALYAKWLGFPGGLNKAMLEKVERLKGFRFHRHHRYNLSARRLEAIEDFTQKRVAEILEFGVKADRCVSISKKNCTVNPTNCESLALQIKENLKADPYITKDELAEILGVSARSIAYKLKQLKDAGVIERCGAAKNGYWKILK